MIRLAIFDCDGTLVDSGATIHKALTLALAAHGRVVPPPRAARRVIGLSLFEAMEHLVPDAPADELTAMAETYRRSFQGLRGAGQVEEPLFDGIAELIDALASDGWSLAVATGKSDRGLAHCLDRHGLAGRFVSLQTADRHPSKPHPAMALAAMAEAGASAANSVMIGDTGWDMGCARGAGIGAIGVGWGYHDAAELMAEGAHCVAQEPADVLRLACHWVERGA
ncbi:HAD hydrolase-like protein [Sphingomonas sp.]|uniref:HAD hydrolase-like protein n=1 Tax=Sphingomonas sp. TaxID=28214 RepID=UPI00286A28B9|nr:HAD hydrolase-like protein [Sphingomonas sp.]